MANPYYIKIELPDDNQQNNAVSGTTTNTSNTTDNAIGSGNAEMSAASVLKSAKKIVAVTGTAAIADKMISYSINTVNLRTGASEYEQRLEETYSGIKRAGGAAFALIFGAATGNLPFALLGLTVSATQQVIGIVQKQEEINTNRSLENVSIGMATVRAGVSGRRGANQ